MCSVACAECVSPLWSACYHHVSSVRSQTDSSISSSSLPLLLHRDTLSSTEVACLTAPYPSAWEGGYSSQLLVTLTVNGTEYSSGSRYMYRWRLTPEVRRGEGERKEGRRGEGRGGGEKGGKERGREWKRRQGRRGGRAH